MSETLINPLTQTPIPDSQIATITELARDLYRTEAQIEAMEDALKEMKEKKQRLQMVLIPEAMEKVGMQSFTLKGKDDQSVVAALVVKPFYSAKIPEENEINAFKWLRDNGHAGLVRTQFQINLTQREQEMVRKVLSTLRRNKIPFDKKDNVHWQTLRAWVRTMKEGGKFIPDDLFGVFVGKTTDIKLYEAN
jgi:hypothetical protein